MQSMMYPHFVFTHTRILQIEFSVIDLVCCFSLDMASDDDSGVNHLGVEHSELMKNI